MDLNKAKQLLETGGHTCVLCRDTQVITSDRRGVAPLMALWEQGADCAGFSAADKVVGKATALLYCLLGVSAVYGKVMSRPALQVLTENGISATYGQLVDAIINRAGTGLCPMETATRHISDPAHAPAAIAQALANLQS